MRPPTLLLPLLLAAAASAAPASRPHILFIFSDDHARHAIGAYGSKVNQTPHLDRLAREGTRFEHCFVTNSICTPSRAVVLTGKYSHANGVPVFNVFDGSQPHVARMLQGSGYHTGMIGKWHLGSMPTGFDRWIILPGQGLYHNPDFLTPHGRLTLPGHVSPLTTRLGIEFLETRPKDRPFFLMLHHKAPHRAWEPDAANKARFRDRVIPEPETLWDDYATRPAALPENRQTVANDLTRRDLKLEPPADLAPGPARQQWLNVKPTEVEVTLLDGTRKTLTGTELVRWKYQRYMQDYLACVQDVDDSIGEVLDYLDRTGLAKDTVVIYSADNGWYLGDLGMYDKRFMYEPGFHIPLLVRGPGVKAGAVTKRFALNADFAPTFLELAGLPVPAEMHGRSLAPILHGAEPADWRTSVYYRYYHDPGHHNTRAHYGVRTATHKLIHYWKKDAWELFDLTRDPNEQRNLVGDPGQAGNLAKLRTELTQLQQQLGDTGQFANEIPRDGVDAPVNVSRLGEKDIRGAIALARP
ncbi:MAG: sulfatase [Verrucomicrobia bacterium]|nr:sulfatase [Verrucomicrobiota bacterium]